MAVILHTTEQLDRIALFIGKQAMEAHVRTGGRMILTRGATPKNIAKRFNLIDPKTKKAPKTAKRCLELITEQLNALDAKDAERRIQVTTGVTLTTLPTTN